LFYALNSLRRSSDLDPAASCHTGFFLYHEFGCRCVNFDDLVAPNHLDGEVPVSWPDVIAQIILAVGGVNKALLPLGAMTTNLASMKSLFYFVSHSVYSSFRLMPRK
jgi:hypothetical protein